MNDIVKPSNTFANLLILFGIALTIGGINLVRMGDNFYFVVVGLGFLSSGVLVRLGKLLGLYAYGLTLAVIVVWSFLEVGANLGQLLPRVTMPLIVGAYLYYKVRPRLS